MSVTVVAIIWPAEGKEARCEELLTDMTKKVTDKEPNTLRYHLHKSTEGTELVVVETYKSAADHHAHKTSEDFQALIKAMGEESLVSKPPVIIPCSSIAGFEAR